MVGGYVRKRVTLRISKGLRVVALAAGISQRVYSDSRVIFITIIVIYIALAEKIGTPLIKVTPKSTTKVQKPVYFVSTVLRDPRERYTTQQKLIYTLLIASKKLHHYFQGHPIRVVTDRPLETILCNQRKGGRVGCGSSIIRDCLRNYQGQQEQSSSGVHC
jgi:hypothetical protein